MADERRALAEKWLYKAGLLASFRAPVVIAIGLI
jgi:hypothetical protein